MERGGFHGYRKSIPNNNINSGNNSTNNNIPLIMNNSHTTVNNNHAAAEESECTVREQDRFMPIANVIRIMRKILPPHAKIADDAKETIQECVSEYISFITGEANERCQREQRKTITAEDVLWAMSKLGFDDYIEPLTLFLHRYRETEGDRTSPAPAPAPAPAFARRAPPGGGLDYAPFAPYGAAAAPPPGYYPSMNGFYGYYKDNATGTGSSSGGGGGSSQAHAMAGSGDQQHLQFK